MIPLAKRAAPAAIAALRQATALRPKRKKASDGLLPSKAHVHQNPNSDHNSGYAVDITHDIVNGVDCAVAFENLKADPRVKYLIFNHRIWSKEKGIREYTGSNPHTKHLHISIKETCGDDTSPWFPWLGKATTVNKVKANIPKPLPKKKESK
jgi:hypothetical protein